MAMLVFFLKRNAYAVYQLVFHTSNVLNVGLVGYWLVNTYLLYWSWWCACNVMQGMGDFLNEIVDMMCQIDNVRPSSFVCCFTFLLQLRPCNVARVDYRKTERIALRSCRSSMRNCFRAISKHFVPPLLLWTLLPIHHLRVPLAARAPMLPTSVIALKCTQKGPQVKTLLDLMPTVRDFVLGLVLPLSLRCLMFFCQYSESCYDKAKNVEKLI